MDKNGYAPDTALFEVTNRCNLNCIFCGSDCKNQVNPAELSIKEWRAVIDELKELGAKKIVLSGGEPTLKNGIDDLIGHIAAKRMKWGMVSNGLFFPADFLKAVKIWRPYAIGISVDGIPETHNKLRGNPQSFQRLVENIKKLQEIKAPVSVITTIHKLNWQELPSVARFLVKNKIYGWQIQLAMPFGRMNERRELLLSQDEFLMACLFVEDIRKTMPFVNIAAADCFAWAPAGKIRKGGWSGCGGGISALGIDSLGNVRGCLSMTGCQPEGNIKEKSLTEIWQDKNLFVYNRRFNPRNASESCQKCHKVLICRGGCNSQSFSTTGKFQQGVYCYYRERRNK